MNDTGERMLVELDNETLQAAPREVPCPVCNGAGNVWRRDYWEGLIEAACSYCEGAATVPEGRR